MMAVRTRPRLVPPPDDNTLVIVLRNPSQVIDRELAAPDDAARIAILMIARRARLEAGDLLTVARAEVDGAPLSRTRPRPKSGPDGRSTVFRQTAAGISTKIRTSVLACRGFVTDLLRSLPCRWGWHSPRYVGGGKWVCQACLDSVDAPEGWS
jgi:hypothetical protein